MHCIDWYKCLLITKVHCVFPAQRFCRRLEHKSHRNFERCSGDERSPNMYDLIEPTQELFEPPTEILTSVKCVRFQKPYKFPCTCSLCKSKEEVASSSKRIFGFLTNARAMAILCFWPPDNWAVLQPTFVS